MSEAGQQPFRNRLLATLPSCDLEFLQKHLQPISLPRRTQLELPNRKIEHVYFVESGIVSIVATMPGSEIEIGIVGHEGMTGHSVIHFDDRSPYAAYMQVEGSGQKIAATVIVDAVRRSEACRKAFFRLHQSVYGSNVGNSSGQRPRHHFGTPGALALDGT